jgi:hypothetical protein
MLLSSDNLKLIHSCVIYILIIFRICLQINIIHIWTNMNIKLLPLKLIEEIE